MMSWFMGEVWVRCLAVFEIKTIDLLTDTGSHTHRRLQETKTPQGNQKHEGSHSHDPNRLCPQQTCSSSIKQTAIQAKESNRQSPPDPCPQVNWDSSDRIINLEAL